MATVTKDRLERRAVEALGRGAHIAVRESPIGWVAEAWTAGNHVAIRVTGVSRRDVYEQLACALARAA